MSGNARAIGRDFMEGKLFDGLSGLWCSADNQSDWIEPLAFDYGEYTSMIIKVVSSLSIAHDFGMPVEIAI
ncbi:hypothetical protein [Polynucleobacter necessarius]|uniref:hypothetical protein n=1 Tax=Polynucleobacter necessarius TaxID=576610 RepID=UPI000E09B0D9|nr:hypothetical protein [Polynucleobacter necessarius]